MNIQQENHKKNTGFMPSKIIVIYSNKIGIMPSTLIGPPIDPRDLQLIRNTTTETSSRLRH